MIHITLNVFINTIRQQNGNIKRMAVIHFDTTSVLTDALKQLR